MKLQAASKRKKLVAFEALCRRGGIPLTVQRRIVLEALLERGDHPTAEQIFVDVRRRIPGVSRTTVYRVLETLVAAGVAGKASHPGAAARFDPVTERHHHLVCVRCERLADLEAPALDRLRLPRTRGFRILDYSIHFMGLCADCRRQGQRPGHLAGRFGRPPRGRAGRRPSRASNGRRREGARSSSLARNPG